MDSTSVNQQQQPRSKSKSKPNRQRLSIDTSIASRSNIARPPPFEIKHQYRHLPPALASSSSRQRHEPSHHKRERDRDRDRHRDTDRHRAPNPKTPETRHHPDESFLDTQTPVDIDIDGEMADHQSSSAARAPNNRDSHDLSYSPRDVTRDSLVANMLLSLDQFGIGQSDDPYGDSNNSNNDGGNAYDDSPQLFDKVRSWSNTAAAYASSNPNARAHRHQYSYSSDLDAGDESSRLSSQVSRGRRSNSSSNFQANIPRLNSVRESYHRSQPVTPRARHSRGGRTSRSSSSASVDAGYSHVLAGGGHRLQQRALERAASFDYGGKHSQLQQSAPMSPFQVEFNKAQIDDFSAAPTPTVPGGPRRTPSTPSMPRQPPVPAQPLPEPERKRSFSRSLKSSSGRKTSNFREEVPALPPVDLDSAPAPHVGYEKSKDAVPPRTAGGNGTAPAQTKEKQPGFFRRVFGSSKNSSPASTPGETLPPRIASPSDRLGSASSSGYMQTSGTQSRAGEAPPSRDTSSSHSHHPTLQKKSSSFFRRRKKSVVDDHPPLPTDAAPPMPNLKPSNLHIDKDRDVSNPEPSPVSSLRKVMNPYLRNGVSTPGSPMVGQSPLADITNTVSDRNDDEVEDRKRDFSPDYEPSPNARIRTVQAEDQNGLLQTGTPSHRTSTRPVQMSGTNDSFLDLDGGSDNDDDSRPDVSAYARKTKSSKDDTIRAKKKKNSPFILRTDSEDDFSRSRLALPMEGMRSVSPASAASSTGRDIRSASGTSSVQAGNGLSPKVKRSLDALKPKSLDEPEFVVGEPTEDDRRKAQNIYDGNEDFIQKEKAASWMGEEGPVRQRTLRAYMDLYDFENSSIVSALRQVCGRLVFRAETQQVDRILVAFSARWCECNSNHGFKATDVIHTICYSIMLLNTDLHLADIESKMTRNQFIKNTMTTIIQAASDAAPDVFDRPATLAEKNGLLSADNATPPSDSTYRPLRNSFRGLPKADSQNNVSGDIVDDCGPLVKSPFNGTMKAWEEQIEVVLKSIYASIRDERLPLYGAEPPKTIPTSQSGLSVMGMLKRSPSVLSKAPSESQLSTRGRVSETGKGTSSRWSSKSRSRPGLGRTGFSSSRTSFEEAGSVFSPALSSATWSKHSLGRTQTSVSQDSISSAMPRGDYQQSIGFANALSQAIIRDEDANDPEYAASIVSDDLNNLQLLEDESLELTGPPWVKEGMVIHKHHLDGVERKAKDRNWTEVFAVVQKGQMSLFSFTSNKSSRQKSRTRNATKHLGPVGGGNWQDNATNMGTFNLRQTLASALPSPGYSRARPHVWALSLPTGAVHLFQVGTPEIIKEFVTTANYWSARLSTHPLIGGISNIEYGWSENIVNNALVAAINDTGSQTTGKTSRPGSSAATGRRSSITSASFRSVSFEHGGSFTHNSGRGKLPGDRIHIANWAPPSQSMRPSTARESEQLEVLAAYVKNIEEELQSHNQLRSPMLLAFTPRAHNATKAMANWERKSAYLLREIVKFNTYVDCLQQAETRKQEIYAERDLAQRAARGELSDGDMEVSGEEGDETLRP